MLPTDILNVLGMISIECWVALSTIALSVSVGYVFVSMVISNAVTARFTVIGLLYVP